MPYSCPVTNGLHLIHNENGTSAGRSLRPMNIFMFTDDSFGVFSLEQAQRNVAYVGWCSTMLQYTKSLLIPCVLASLSILSYQTSSMSGLQYVKFKIKHSQQEKF